MSKELASKRLIDLVETLRRYMDMMATTEQVGLPQNVVELGEGRYRVNRILVEHKGGIDYLVNSAIPVKVFRDGSYGIWDFRVDSEGKRIITD